MFVRCAHPVENNSSNSRHRPNRKDNGAGLWRGPIRKNEQAIGRIKVVIAIREGTAQVAVPFSRRERFGLRRVAKRFGMLLDVANIVRMNERANRQNVFRVVAFYSSLVLGLVTLSFSSQGPSQTAPAAPAAQSPALQASPTTPQGLPQAAPRAGLNVVVLDPAHGGTDPG